MVKLDKTRGCRACVTHLSFCFEEQAVSEEKIFFLEINQSETRIAYGGYVY